MKAAISVWNASFLFLTTAMYLGTGWSMWLFQFPIAPHLSPDTYYWAFVPQVASATTFFTWMTSLMMLSALIMIWLEWKGGIRWVPIVVLLAVLTATGLTVKFIFPYNNAMSAGIRERGERKTDTCELPPWGGGLPCWLGVAPCKSTASLAFDAGLR